MEKKHCDPENRLGFTQHSLSVTVFVDGSYV